MTRHQSGRRVLAELLLGATGLAVAWVCWPRTWADMAGSMILFDAPCCIVPTFVHLLAEPLLIILPVGAWVWTVRHRTVSVGMAVYTVAFAVGFGPFLTHTVDSTEFPSHPYLLYGWVMLLGATVCVAELKWRGRPWKPVGLLLIAGVLVYAFKPFTDMAFAGV